MADKPIPFNAPMVRALLEDRKTQTRQVLKPQPEADWLASEHLEDHEIRGWECIEQPDGRYLIVKRFHYDIGDRLWVGEAWRTCGAFDEIAPRNLDVATPRQMIADGQWINPCNLPVEGAGLYRPAMDLPRWASRLTLIVTDVRVERLQDISEEDAKAEGLSCLSKDHGRTWKWGIPDRDGWPGNDDAGWHWPDWKVDPRVAFARLWDGINGPGAWQQNPWVAAYTFTVEHRNIDSTERHHEPA